MARLLFLPLLFTSSFSAQASNPQCMVHGGSCNEEQVEHAEQMLADSVELLQVALERGKVAPEPLSLVADEPEDQAFAWDQITKAIQIDELLKKISSASDDAQQQVAEWKGQLAQLQKQCPDAALIKEKLSASWSQLTQAVDVESLKAQLEEAKKAGSSAVESLQEQYQAAVKGFNLDTVKTEFQNQWAEVQSQFPDLDQVKLAWAYLSKASEAASKAADAAAKAAQGIWEDQAFAWDQVTKAVKIDELQDKINNVSAEAHHQVEEWQAQLDELKKQCPDAAQIKEKLSAIWLQLKEAVDVESLKAQLEEAKKAGSSTVQSLEDQYEAAVKELNVEAVKNQLQHQWADVQRQLPDLEETKKAWESTWSSASTAVSDAAAQASEAASKAAAQASEAASKAADAASSAGRSIWEILGFR